MEVFVTENLPEVIYHYCPVESFFNIVKEKSIFASLHTSLNDYTESAWFFHLLIEEAKKRSNESNSKVLNSFLDNVFVNIKDYFITSFSKEKDILSQWRAYSNNGQGVAIGFYTNSFGIPIQVPHYSDDAKTLKGIFEIDYNTANQNNLASQIIDYVLSGNDQFHDSFERLTLTIKNPAFYEEKEIRIVEIIDTRLNLNPDMFGLRTRNVAKHIEYRSNSKDIIPYRKFPILNNDKRIHSLILGPKCEITEKHLLLFLEANEIEIVDGIYFSSSTYR